MKIDGLVLTAIETETRYQRLKAVQNKWKKDKEPVEYAVLMEAEIQEAKLGFCKNDTSNFGRNTVEHEILQTVCLGLEMLGSLSDEKLHELIDSTVRAAKHQFGVEG
jgi:hypothetical protein